jgi:hypothetical protein
MRLTIYQVEHILERWHKARYGNAKFGSSEPIRLTNLAREHSKPYRAQTAPSLGEVTPSNILQRIADITIHDPVVDYEEQRRAGLFLSPPFVPQLPPPSIPKLRERIRILQEIRERNAQRRKRTIEDLASQSTITLTQKADGSAVVSPKPTASPAADLAQPFQRNEAPVEAAAAPTPKPGSSQDADLSLFD